MRKAIPFILLVISLQLMAVFFPVDFILAGTTGKISGKIIDISNGEALPGANVRIEGTFLGAATNLEGDYAILNIPPGTYNIIVSFIGYKTQKREEVRVQIDKTTKVDFSLESTVLVGEEVVVVAQQPNYIEPDLTSSKQTYVTKNVEKIAGVSDIADIIDLQADVVDNHFRGGREGEANYLIGGTSIINPLNNSSSFQPMVAALEQVEVITSGFSAEYGNAQSGVVNMVPREGGNKWTVQIDYSMDLPHYQQFEGNPFSKENNPFFEQLSDPEEWIRKLDLETQVQPVPLIDYLWKGELEDYLITDENKFYLIINFPQDLEMRRQVLHRDSLRAAQFGIVNYMTAVRDIGLEHDNMPQQRVDLYVGGPIFNNVRLFLSARQQQNKRIVPTPIPDLTRQLMGNLTFTLSKNDKVNLSYHNNAAFINQLSSSSHQNWFDRVLHVGKVAETSQLYGLKWNHFVNPLTYFDIAFNVLDNSWQQRIEFLDPERYRMDGYNGFQSGIDNHYTYLYRNTPSGHQLNVLTFNRGYENTTTSSFNGSLVSQIDKFNLIKFGIQYQRYDIDVDREINAKSPVQASYILFSGSPYEGAVYLQDKMEFEGMIANVGLRYDFYNYNFAYYQDIFARTLPKDAELTHTEFVSSLQPRLGISFPLSEKSVFHLNYGSFVQRPRFNNILYNQLDINNVFQRRGNPNLEPEITESYELGVVQALPWGIRFDISAFYKDVKNLTEEAIYVNKNNEVYINYGNLDYAMIKGFNINMEKTSGFFGCYLKYNYQNATGKASAPGGAPVTFYQQPVGDGSTIDLPDPEDFLMDFDIPHRFVGTVSFFTPREFGPALFNIHPFANLSISTTFTIQSGRPYTDDTVADEVLVNNKRMPHFSNLRMRLEKDVHIGKYRYTLYCEGFNLLNHREWNLSIFRDYRNLERWLDGDREEFRFYDSRYEEQPNELLDIYQYSRSSWVWSNQPRYFRLGLKVTL